MDHGALHIKTARGAGLTIGHIATPDGEVSFTARTFAGASITVWIGSAARTAIQGHLDLIAEANGERDEPIRVGAAEVLTGETDAFIWARRFMAVLKDTQADEAVMRGWFASAIETGRAAGRAEGFLEGRHAEAEETDAKADPDAGNTYVYALDPAAVPDDTWIAARAKVMLEMITSGLIDPATNPGTNAAKRALQFVLGIRVEERT